MTLGPVAHGEMCWALGVLGFHPGPSVLSLLDLRQLPFGCRSPVRSARAVGRVKQGRLHAGQAVGALVMSVLLRSPSPWVTMGE